MDAAEAWLKHAVLAHPPLADWVESFEKLADEQVRVWQLRDQALLKGLQKAETLAVSAAKRGGGAAGASAAGVMSATRAFSYILTRVARGLMMGHETLSIFLAPADEPLPRQHKVMLMCSALLAMLCVSIWMEVRWRRGWDGLSAQITAFLGCRFLWFYSFGLESRSTH